MLLLIRYHAAAGSKSFEFFNTYEAIQERIRNLSSRTCVVAFRDQQLPVRGTVDSDLASTALANIPDGTEWLAVSLHLTKMGAASWFHDVAGETHSELREALEDNAGKVMAIGPYPPWLEDSETAISAVVPEPDGNVVTGIY